SPDQRDVFAELVAVQFDQAAAVGRFLLAHAVKHGCRSGEVLAEPLDKVRVNSLVFLFQRNGQGQYFLLSKAFKATHKLTGNRKLCQSTDFVGILLYCRPSTPEPQDHAASLATRVWFPRPQRVALPGEPSESRGSAFTRRQDWM